MLLHLLPFLPLRSKQGVQFADLLCMALIHNLHLSHVFIADLLRHFHPTHFPLGLTQQQLYRLKVRVIMRIQLKQTLLQLRPYLKRYPQHSSLWLKPKAINRCKPYLLKDLPEVLKVESNQIRHLTIVEILIKVPLRFLLYFLLLKNLQPDDLRLILVKHQQDKGLELLCDPPQVIIQFLDHCQLYSGILFWDDDVCLRGYKSAKNVRVQLSIAMHWDGGQ